MGPDNEQKLTSPLFSLFVELVWKSINKHIIIQDQKGSSLYLWHWQYLYFCLTGKWFEVNELNQMIPYQPFPLLFYFLRKVWAYIFLFKNELLPFFSLTHPYFAPTLEYEWDPRFFAPSRIAAIEVLCARIYCVVITIWHLSFRSYHSMFGVVGHTFFSAFFILKYTTLNNDKKMGSARGRLLNANKKLTEFFMRSLIWSKT